MGGIASKAPKLAILFLLLVLGSVALPLTDSFVGEFLMLSGLFKWNMWAMIIAGTSVIFSAVYMLRLYQKTMFGVVNENTENVTDISWNELLVLSICSGLMLFLGLFPNALMQVSNPVLEQILSNFSRF
jgi:NADH-quinone oxidoreductase subunit M